jgi:SAM-dependent methyltransferase
MSMRGTIAKGSASHGRYATDQPPTGERRRMLERVPAGATVLDVGCWSGSAGKFLIKHRNAIVDGIEPNSRAASLARRSYRQVFGVRFEDFLAHHEGQYECVLFLDVLEHLPDPAETLKRSCRLLTSNGKALVSLPNIAYWWVRKELLLGRWQYEDTGLLDRTHLRFFTLASAVDLFGEAGWSIRWRSESLGQTPIIACPKRWQKILKRWPSLFAVQFLFELQPNIHFELPTHDLATG